MNAVDIFSSNVEAIGVLVSTMCWIVVVSCAGFLTNFFISDSIFTLELFDLDEEDEEDEEYIA